MTRHPKNKRWTTKELQAIKPDWVGDYLNDGDGLIGEVRCTQSGVISVAFRYGFKWEGKKKWFYAGTWPAIDMARIREVRNEARDLIRQGINPNDKKEADRIENQKAVLKVIEDAEQERIQTLTVRDLFDAWIHDGVLRSDGNTELCRLFSKDVLPYIGDIPLTDLNDSHIRELLRKQRERGVTRLVVMTHADLRQMFAWGEKRRPWRPLLIDGNPVDLVEVDKLLPHDYVKERARILTASEIKELANIFARMEADYLAAEDKRATTRPLSKKTQLALWICLGTACRIGELLQARWEHVDFDKGVWFIPRENVKGGRGKKQEHYVFLSRFAHRHFEALKEMTGQSEWLFPSKNQRTGEETHVDLKSVSKQVGDRQICFKNRSKPLIGRAFDDSLVLSGGLSGEWTPHDLRRTASTMMQALKIVPDVIDRCLNHVIAGSRVRRHYLHFDYMEEKKEAWDKLGAHLDSILVE